MNQEAIVWTQQSSLSEITFWRDWDLGTSMISSLRYYLFEHGTVPLWNISLCGGKPELANPNSWAFAWHSIFGYFLQPIEALIGLWIIISVYAFCCLWFFLRGFGISSAAATLSAILYCINGYFSSHFNQGHAWWMCHLLIPMLLVLQKSFSPFLQSRPDVCFSLNFLVSFMFFSTAIPHPIFHFYPAFILYFGIIFFQKLWRSSTIGIKKTLLPPLLGHMFGILASAYKLIPIAAWQLNFPRDKLIDTEWYSFKNIFDSFTTLSFDYFYLQKYFDTQIWGYWEYNTFVGNIALALALITPLAFLTLIFKPQLNLSVHFEHKQKMLVLFAMILFFLGINLSLGNANKYSLAQIFPKIPILNGIRVFSRYQILSLLSLSCLFGVTLTHIEAFLQRRYRPITGMLITIALGLIAVYPACYQAGILIWNIKGVADSSLESNYGIKRNNFGFPVYMKQFRNPDYTTQNMLFKNGYFVASCYEPMRGNYINLDKFPAGFSYPISNPPPQGIKEVTYNSLVLPYSNSIDGNIQLNLILPANSRTEPPGEKIPDSEFMSWSADKLRGRQLKITFDIRNEKIGFLLTSIFLVFTLATGTFFWANHRKNR